MHCRAFILHSSAQRSGILSAFGSLSAGNTLLLILSLLLAVSAVAVLVAVGLGLLPFAPKDPGLRFFPDKSVSLAEPVLPSSNDPWSALEQGLPPEPCLPEPSAAEDAPEDAPQEKMDRPATHAPTGPVHVEAVTFEKAADGSETVCIRADGTFVPEVFRLQGENPFGSNLRMVIDVGNTASVGKAVSTMDVGARFVRRVRTRFDAGKQRLRTVLDLAPEVPFQVARSVTSEGRHFVLRLFEEPPPGSPEPQEVLEPPEPPAQALQRKAPPSPKPTGLDDAVRIRAVSYDGGGAGERILIHADRVFEPTVFGLEGSNPFGEELRLVMDIRDALPVLGDPSPIYVNGQLIRRIRHHYYKNERKLRLVLDLAPAAGYTASQTFFEKQNLYALTLMEEGSPGTSEAPESPPHEPTSTVAEAAPAETVPDTERCAAPASPGSPPVATLIPAALHEHVDPVPPGPEPLRNQGVNLTANDLRALFLHHGFYSTCGAFNTTYCNPDGAFENDFQARSDGTVCDRATGLLWQREGSTQAMSWAAAEDYILDLNRSRFAGHDDWRLPTLEELLSLMEDSWQNGDLFIGEAFEQTQRSCWSADTHGADKAWKTQFHLGYAADAFRTDRNWVRAVRTIPGPARWAGPPPPVPTPSDDLFAAEHPGNRHPRTSSAGDSLLHVP